MNTNHDPKELLQMVSPKPVKVQVGDIVKFDNEMYKVVEVKGKSLHIKLQVFPFESFLVDSESVVIVN